MLKHSSPHKATTNCVLYGKEAILISQSLGLCLNCIHQDFEKAEPIIQQAHKRSSQPFNLLPLPLRAVNGVICHLCTDECHLSDNGHSYCDLRLPTTAKIVGANIKKGNVRW